MSNPCTTYSVRENGTLSSIAFKTGEQTVTIPFFDGDHEGPALYLDLDGSGEERLELKRSGAGDAFETTSDNLSCQLSFTKEEQLLRLNFSASNTSDSDIKVKHLRLRMGVDGYMIQYPEWRKQFFPTMLRSEPTHFWGYAMSPEGTVLAVCSPDPVAAWSIDFNTVETDNPDYDGIVGTSRLFGFYLDFLHCGPLPDHNPEEMDGLSAGETRHWSVSLSCPKHLEDMPAEAAKRCDAPIFRAERYSVAEGESIEFDVLGNPDHSLSIEGPDGVQRAFRVLAGTEAVSRYAFRADKAGVYSLTVESAAGKAACCRLSALKNWSWYLKQARIAADKHGQYASSHCEQWLGLHSAFLARKHMPDPELDARLWQRFNDILDCMWDRETGRPIPEKFGRHTYRLLTNSAQMISVLCDAYEVDGSREWLHLAGKLADYLMNEWQREDVGCFAAEDCMGRLDYVIYSSVLYPVKSIMELCLIERELAEKDASWSASYDRHHGSVKRAIEHLERVRDNLNTEGNQVFEDGMISCSATQLAMYALHFENKSENSAIKEAADQLFSMHRCEEQLMVPDSRIHGGSLRFWEAQYDVLARGKGVNMICSPHGWTAWSLYGMFYMYQLTGEESWLLRLLNGMGACVQVIDAESGEMNWSFICDPYVEARLLEENPATPGRGVFKTKIIGETYLPMIASFHYPHEEPVLGNSSENGWACGNDVHEIIKCMAETVLIHAIAHRKTDGTWITLNCSVDEENGRAKISVTGDLVQKLHVNGADHLQLDYDDFFS